VYLSLYSMYVTMSISTGLYPNLDLWNANKLCYITLHYMNIKYIQLQCLMINQVHLQHQNKDVKNDLFQRPLPVGEE